MLLVNLKNINFICLYSNADARKINDALKNTKNMFVFKNLKEHIFLSLMKHASFMLGNSSAGIREAPSFNLPVINIGTRQNGRLRAKNVIDVDHNTNKIIKAIKYALNNENFLNNLKRIRNPYGDGKAAKRIVSILKKLILTKLIYKKYLMMIKKNILITGGAGTIGIELVRLYQKKF